MTAGTAPRRDADGSTDVEEGVEDVDAHGPSLEDLPEPGVLPGERVVLEPLQVAHASEVAHVFDDLRLHTFIGGTPATEAQLVDRYRRQVAGWSPDRSERWQNWVVRRRVDDQVVGTVQATVTVRGRHLAAEVAWVVATAYQRHGHAKDAASTMVQWLRSLGVSVVAAHVHPDHQASQGVARALGLRKTGTWHDGEERWEG
jgi:RimJ/RimL family protein N-acetyltransferase